MNKIYIGRSTNIEIPKGGCLFIHDEVPTIPRARIFHPTKHSFNPLKDIDYRRATDIVDIFDALFSRGDSTLTKDTGLDAIAEELDNEPGTLAALIAPPDKKSSTGQVWAYGKVQRLMRSPVLKQMLCHKPNFDFTNPTILARVNRAELGDFDALAIGLFLIGHFQGQVVLPDGGFYLRDTHVSLIREQRLIAGVRFLDELPEKLRQEVMLIEHKELHGVLYDDAGLLAKHAGHRPNPLIDDNDFNEFIDAAMKR